MLRSRNFLDVRLSASGIKKPSLKRAAQDCRTKAGMAHAKANGIKIGRPKLGIEIRQKIMQRAKKVTAIQKSPRRLELIDILPPST